MTSDSTLKEDVLAELEWDDGVDAAHVGVTTVDGSVTLTGHVERLPEKYAALEAAKRVRGVLAVADEIDVRLPEELRSKDGDIARRIAHVLEWNVSIPDATIKAEVSSGFVTLTGEVERDSQRRHVEAQVRHVGGVVGLSNAIQLTSRATASDVLAGIKSALRRSAEVEASGVKVSVAGDTVTLNGRVKAYYERDLIRRAAWHAPGVQRVVDNITIGA